MEEIYDEIVKSKCLFSFPLEKITVSFYRRDVLPVPEIKIGNTSLTFWMIYRKDDKVIFSKYILTNIEYYPGLSRFLKFNKNNLDKLVLVGK